MLELVTPSEQYLPFYVAALKRGWSADTVRGAEAAVEELAKIERDPTVFIATKADDREAKGGDVKLPDGSFVKRLPCLTRWMWDGEFCGSINCRWQPGTGELPPHVLGHTGYSVVPWKRGRGYATRALGLLLEEMKAEGLPYIEITMDADNVASEKVVKANGGQFVERFGKPAQYGEAEALRYRIAL